MSCLHVVPDTSSQSVAPAVEVVVHIPPMEVRSTGGNSLCLDIVLGVHPRVAPASVGGLCDHAHLSADVFRSPDHDMDLGSDNMAPLEHHLASGPLYSPHRSL